MSGSWLPGVTSFVMLTHWPQTVVCMRSEHPGGFRDLECGVFLREVGDSNPRVDKE